MLSELAGNGFAKKSSAGPRAAAGVAGKHGRATGMPGRNGPVGRKLPPVASASDPDAEGFAVAFAESAADSAVAVLNSTPSDRGGKS